MRKQIWISIGFVSLVVLSSCIEHSKKEKPGKTNKQEETSDHNQFEEKEYKGLRVYSGKIPCADCSEIQQRLVLKGDTIGVYRLTEVYKNATEDGDATIVSTGEWKLKKTAKEEHLIISQGHLGDSIRTASYTFTDKKLVQRDLDGETIKTTWNYVLKRSK